MENNKKYLDKVVGSLVRSTKLDYEEDIIHYPFSFNPYHLPPFPSLFFTVSSIIPSSFLDYCRDQFGLTNDEIEYAWKEYKSIIKDKISNRES